MARRPPATAGDRRRAATMRNQGSTSAPIEPHRSTSTAAALADELVDDDEDRGPNGGVASGAVEMEDSDADYEAMRAREDATRALHLKEWLDEAALDTSDRILAAYLRILPGGDVLEEVLLPIMTGLNIIGRSADRHPGAWPVSLSIDGVSSTHALIAPAARRKKRITPDSDGTENDDIFSKPSAPSHRSEKTATPLAPTQIVNASPASTLPTQAVENPDIIPAEIISRFRSSMLLESGPKQPSTAKSDSISSASRNAVSDSEQTLPAETALLPGTRLNISPTLRFGHLDSPQRASASASPTVDGRVRFEKPLVSPTLPVAEDRESSPQEERRGQLDIEATMQVIAPMDIEATIPAEAFEDEDEIVDSSVIHQRPGGGPRNLNSREAMWNGETQYVDLADDDFGSQFDLGGDQAPNRAATPTSLVSGPVASGVSSAPTEIRHPATKVPQLPTAPESFDSDMTQEAPALVTKSSTAAFPALSKNENGGPSSVSRHNSSTTSMQDSLEIARPIARSARKKAIMDSESESDGTLDEELLPPPPAPLTVISEASKAKTFGALGATAATARPQTDEPRPRRRIKDTARTKLRASADPDLLAESSDFASSATVAPDPVKDLMVPSALPPVPEEGNDGEERDILLLPPVTPQATAPGPGRGGRQARTAMAADSGKPPTAPKRGGKKKDADLPAAPETPVAPAPAIGEKSEDVTDQANKISDVWDPPSSFTATTPKPPPMPAVMEPFSTQKKPAGATYTRRGRKPSTAAAVVEGDTTELEDAAPAFHADYEAPAAVAPKGRKARKPASTVAAAQTTEASAVKPEVQVAAAEVPTHPAKRKRLPDVDTLPVAAADAVPASPFTEPKAKRRKAPTAAAAAASALAQVAAPPPLPSSSSSSTSPRSEPPSRSETSSLTDLDEIEGGLSPTTTSDADAARPAPPLPIAAAPAPRRKLLPPPSVPVTPAPPPRSATLSRTSSSATAAAPLAVSQRTASASSRKPSGRPRGRTATVAAGSGDLDAAGAGADDERGPSRAVARRPSVWSSAPSSQDSGFDDI
ncbi:hypothetical protein HK405_008364, partial [Cladochytrium tenue]